MTRMNRVHLVRHGEADYGPVNDRGWPGLASELAPLTPAGIAQAVAAADELAGAGVSYLVCSPATRALQTAAVIGHRLALGLHVEFELRDWLPDRTGTWRGPADARAAYRELTDCGGEWPAGVSRPWEPLSDVRERALAALRRHLADAGRPIIAVSHAVVIGSLTGDLDPPPGSVHRYLPDLAAHDA
jgi:broad specificity phosphatase PhoE